MTYMKYVDMNLCCFIPGKVIDEIYRVLRFIQNDPNPPRVHELLQELRDISSMAMEWFEEKIAPHLKSKLNSPISVLLSVPFRGLPVQGTSNSSSGTSPSFAATVRGASDREEDFSKIQQTLRQMNNVMKKDMNDYKIKMNAQVKEVQKQNKELHQKVTEQGATLVEQSGRIQELAQKLLEYDKHLVTPEALASRTTGKKKVIPETTTSIHKKAPTSETVHPKKSDPVVVPVVLPSTREPPALRPNTRSQAKRKQPDAPEGSPPKKVMRVKSGQSKTTVPTKGRSRLKK
jgi:septum formation inhibitor MinC